MLFRVLLAFLVTSIVASPVAAARRYRSDSHREQSPPISREESGVVQDTIVEEGSVFEDGPIDGAEADLWQPTPAVWNPFAMAGDCGPGCHPYFYAGFDFVLVKPHFDDGTALLRTRTDQVSFETTSTEAFDYDVELSPRVFLGYVWESGLGARIRFWQFDHGDNPLVARPDADGLGTVSSPFLLTGNVFVPSTSVPGQTLSAASGLKVDALDVEMTKGVQFDHWALMLGGGIRYGQIDQTYTAEVRDAGGQLLSSARFDHGFDGVGPTVSLQARRPLIAGFKFFSTGRIAILFGDGKSTLEAVDNPQFLTRRTSSRDDLVTVGELSVGLEWARRWYGYGFFFRAALEGQTWQGAGTPTSEDGDLGFVGTSITVGLDF